MQKHLGLRVKPAMTNAVKTKVGYCPVLAVIPDLIQDPSVISHSQPDEPAFLHAGAPWIAGQARNDKQSKTKVGYCPVLTVIPDVIRDPSVISHSQQEEPAFAHAGAAWIAGQARNDKRRKTKVGCCPVLTVIPDVIRDPSVISHSQQEEPAFAHAGAAWIAGQARNDKRRKTKVGCCPVLTVIPDVIRDPSVISHSQQEEPAFAHAGAAWIAGQARNDKRSKSEGWLLSRVGCCPVLAVVPCWLLSRIGWHPVLAVIPDMIRDPSVISQSPR